MSSKNKDLTVYLQNTLTILIPNEILVPIRTGINDVQICFENGLPTEIPNMHRMKYNKNCSVTKIIKQVVKPNAKVHNF